jgi:hypothetical protein
MPDPICPNSKLITRVANDIERLRTELREAGLVLCEIHLQSAALALRTYAIVEQSRANLQERDR